MTAGSLGMIVVLPIIGAVKAGDGTLYRYPLIGGMV